MRKCASINRGVKHLLHDVGVGFNGGKCSLTDVVCKPIAKEAVQKVIKRSFRFAQEWGVKFHGPEFNLYNYWQPSSVSNFNKLSFSLLGDETITIDTAEDLFDYAPGGDTDV